MLVVSLEFIRVLQPPRTPTDDGGILGLCDMFFQERYMQAIQYEAPHLLRYCACAVIMSKRRRGMIKDISRIMQVEPYRDPMLEFFDQLFVKFDFDAAQKALENCEADDAKRFFPFEIRRRVQRTRANAHLRNVLQSSKNNQNRRIGQEVELGHRSCGKMDRKLD